MSIEPGSVADLPDLMTVMTLAFDPRFGEGWTAAQCLGLLATPGTLLLVARDPAPVGFALARTTAGECELMMLGVVPTARRQGLGGLLLDRVVTEARRAASTVIFLEMRKGNSAAQLYIRAAFEKVGTRTHYYRGAANEVFDAETYRRILT